MAETRSQQEKVFQISDEHIRARNRILRTEDDEAKKILEIGKLLGLKSVAGEDDTLEQLRKMQREDRTG